MTPEQSRLEADRALPRSLTLWRAAVALRSPLTFMQLGAHPDDETSAMLAALRFRDGLDLAYVCSTRGEGGQNDIGREAGPALGTLRTAEMERAADRLDMRVRWMTPDPDDPVRDFGFSKSGEETLGRWGREATLDRFAHALRAIRPDMLCATFLDVPGQHGHHRAMTLLAPEAIARAADPTWRTPDLAPWSVPKLYLPAWSGAGTAYDDDLPPPPATTVVSGDGVEGASGWTWERIGQHSRAMHRTQGMGRWPGEARDVPLHLVGGTEEAGVTDNLPATWEALGWPGGARLDTLVTEILETGALADVALRLGTEALSLLPGDRDHRAARLQRQLHRLLFLASGAEARGWVEASFVRPAAAAPVVIETRPGVLEDLEARVSVPTGWEVRDGALAIDPRTKATPYPDSYDPLDPPLPALDVTGTMPGGGRIELRLPLDRTPAARPDGVALEPEAQVINLRIASTAPLTLSSDDTTLDLPDGLSFDGGHIAAPKGRHEVPVTRNGTAAQLVTEVTAPHTPPRVLARPAVMRLLALDAALPEGRIGYIGAGHDRIDHWLRRIGVDVVAADPDALDGLDTLVIGVFAMRFRPGLARQLPAISDWVRAGGTLVTLYHRPWDAWDPAVLPAPMEIGQPSLRWRVTDPNAAVTVLAPDHPVLTGPNSIGAEDWQDWDKERGLYFAARWDSAYTPLLSMSDPGEAPLEGALVSGDIGAGRHTHCALILHHQMERLVPGAFRLMANLCAPRRC
ncbi:MAG: PIG-L family deacetylase [Pseudomonadota bacterium]